MLDEETETLRLMLEDYTDVYKELTRLMKLWKEKIFQHSEAYIDHMRVEG